MSTKSASRILRNARYAYVLALFVLMAGFFSPLIAGGSADAVAYGTLSLLLGLVAVWPLYKAASDEKSRPFYLGVGVGLIAISMVFVLTLTGRV